MLFLTSPNGQNDLKLKKWTGLNTFFKILDPGVTR